MRNRRSLIIVIAALFAVITFLGTLIYLRGVDERAYGKAKLVDVFVVKAAIPKGTTGEQAIASSMVGTGKIPQQYRPGSALMSLDDLKGRVAVNALSQDQILVSGQFVSPNLVANTFANRIPAGQVAMTISVDQTHSVAGFIKPGDQVNVMTYGKDPTTKDDRQTARVMYQNVNVLAVGSNVAPAPGEGTKGADKSDKSDATQAVPNNLITLALPLDAAQRIALPASGSGGSSIYLVLVPPESQAVSPTPGPLDLQAAYNNLPPTPYK